MLSVEDEAIIVAFRRYTLLPLDDCLYALQATLPHLTRSSLHRCLQRHGISRLPEVKGDKPDKRKFKTYPIGHFHVDIAEVRTEEGKVYLFVAIDRTSKFAFVELHEKATMRGATDFLQALIKAVPYKSIPCLPTTAFSSLTWRRIVRSPPQCGAVIRLIALASSTASSTDLTKPNHPWTNGQVERMNRTIKGVTVQRDYDETHDQLRGHLADFVMAYNFARRLKTLSGLSPYEYICKTWSKEPDHFTRGRQSIRRADATILAISSYRSAASCRRAR